MGLITNSSELNVPLSYLQVQINQVYLILHIGSTHKTCKKSLFFDLIELLDGNCFTN